MKTLRAILGYTVAGLSVPLVIIVLMLLMSGALADTVVGATGLTLAPAINGGEVARTIEHGLYRAEVHRMAKQELLKLDDTKYSGKLGGIARDINATVEHFTHAPMPKSETAKKDISAILDAKSASADGKSFDVSQPPPAKAAVPPPAAMAASARMNSTSG